MQENDKYFFSIFGYLDAAADTQWARITPAREQLNAPAEVPEMEVTLENLNSSETVVMKDSFFASGSGFNYINFYTLADIEPGQSYRIQAKNAKGNSSAFTLSIPAEFVV